MTPSSYRALRRAPMLAAAVAALSLTAAASAPAAGTSFNTVTPVGDPAGYAQTPFALAGPNGTSSVIWRDSNAETVLLRKVDRDGIPAATTSTLSVPGYYENTPEAAQAANGAVGVFWQKIQMGSYTQSLRFVHVAPDGTQTATNQVGTTGTSSPSVGLAADGSGWLSWTQRASTNRYAIFVARVAPDGTVGTPVPVSDTSVNSDYARIAVAANGAAWVIWQDSNDDALRAAYAAPGGSFGAVQRIPADDPDDDTFALAIDATGDAVLSYTDDPSDVDYATELVRLPAGGTPTTPVRLEVVDDSDIVPSVAVRPDGSGLVTWQFENANNHDEVHVRSFDAAGTLSAIRVASNPALDLQREPKAVVGNGGREAVIWFEDNRVVSGLNNDYQVKVREYAADGTASPIESISGVLPAATPTAGELNANYSPDGTFVAVWTARPDNNSTTQIYVRSALAAPANVTVPTTGADASAAGSTVTGAIGDWSGTGPLTYAYQWLRCTSATDASACTPIDGATAKDYRVVDADLAAGYLRLRVTATNSVEPAGVSALSSAIRVLAGPAVAPAPSTPAAPAAPAAPVGLSDEAMRTGLAVTEDGYAQIPLTCPATVTGCDADGLLSIALPKAARTKKKARASAAAAETVLARFAGVKIASGHSKLVKVRLKPSVFRRLQKAGVRRVRVTLHTNNHLNGHAPVQATQRVWLRIPALAKVCKASRTLKVRWVLPKGTSVTSVTVTANGRVVARPAADARSVKVRFAARSPSATLVKVVVVTADGRKLGTQRLRLLCGGRRPAGYHGARSLVLKPIGK